LFKRCPESMYCALMLHHMLYCLAQCAVFCLSAADLFKRCPELMYGALTLHHILYCLTLCIALQVYCRSVQALPGANALCADAA
jgi:hypothetical protein